jgi:hypothetical protein
VAEPQGPVRDKRMGGLEASLAGSEHGGMLVVVGGNKHRVPPDYLHEIMRAYVRSILLM